MASFSSAQNPQCAPGSSSSTVERYEEPSRTLLTPIDSLEVLCELIIYFESMKENDFDLTADVEFQGWIRYFDRLLGPVFLKLVKEFWIHASSSNHQVTSYVMEKKITITKELIAKLIGHNDLKDYFRICEKKIILGCINHRKPTSSPDYINMDQQFMLYFIASKAKINVPHMLFNHLRTSVKETREDERTKRDWIPLGKLISDILTENKLVEYLTEAQQINTLEACAGKPINAKNLKKMKIIDNIKKDPTIATKEVITIRRVPLKDFPLLSQINASPEIMVRYLEACKMDGTNPGLNIRDLHQQAPEVVLKKSRKRIAVGERSSQKIPKAAKKKEFQAPYIENPNFQATLPENPNVNASQPENPNIDSDTTTPILGITEPLMVQQPLSIHNIPEIPSPYHSTPPNTPPSPIIIYDSPSPSPINPPEDHLRTIIDLEVLDHLASNSHKIAIPKTKPTITKEYVGRNLLIFETEIIEWVNSLKRACLEILNPAASDSN
ncbi:hypothetical protein RYX36_007048 [Vicia faba]